MKKRIKMFAASDEKGTFIFVNSSEWSDKNYPSMIKIDNSKNLYPEITPIFISIDSRKPRK